MKLESSNFKIYLGGVYLIVLLIAVYFLFSTFDLKDLTSYELIKENREMILKYKDNNIFFLTIIFFIITIFLNLLLCPMLIPTLVIGFIFGKWLGTLILIFGNTLGGLLLYRLAKTFFSDLIERKFKTKFSKFIGFFNKNEKQNRYSDSELYAHLKNNGDNINHSNQIYNNNQKFKKSLKSSQYFTSSKIYKR